MRPGHLFLVLALVATRASAAVNPAPETIARARQLFESGVTYERLGQYAQAVDALTQAIRTRALLSEDAARAQFDRGVAYDALGDTPHALSDYTAALRLAPKLSAALSNRANAYRRLGRWEQAKRDYLAALRCPRVSSQYSYYGLGLIAETLGDRETARDYFRKALAVDPSYALAAQSLSALAAPIPINAAATAPQENPTKPLKPTNTAHPAKTAAEADKPGTPMNAQAIAETDNRQLNLRRTIGDIPDQSSSPPTVQVQLGAFREEHLAVEAWSRIRAAFGRILDGQKPIIIAVDLGGRGRFWRLRTGIPDKQSAKKICTNLQAVGQACLLAGN